MQILNTFNKKNRIFVDKLNICGQTKHVLMGNIFGCVKKGLSQNEQ